MALLLSPKVRAFYPASVLLPLGLAACIARWNALVRYSDRPAPPDQPVEEAVYEAVLRSVGAPDSAVIDSARNKFAYTVAGQRPGAPGYWADTLRREVGLALSDTGLGRRADSELVASAARRLGIELISPIVAESVELGRTTEARFRHFIPRIYLSRPGFNRDSTIAVIEVEIDCGVLCGSGETLFLARRPGFQWQIWEGRRHWIS